MNRRSVFALTSAAAILPYAGMALAQTAAPAPAAQDAAKQPILLAGNFSLLVSQIAAERATADAVRAFAALEVSEQQAIAQAFGSAPGNQVSADDAATLEALRAMQAGAEFDRMYVDSQIAAHEQVRALHAAYAADGADPMARGASTIAVPAIESHLAMLRMIGG